MSETNVKVITPRTVAAQAVITENGNARTIVSVGDFVRVQAQGHAWEGKVLGIFEDGFLLGWLDHRNVRQYDSFGWDAMVIVF